MEETQETQAIEQENQRNELIAEKNALQDLLTQKDYAARKVIFEMAAIVKSQFPSVPTPEYDKYILAERDAKGFRARINEIDEQLA